MSSEHLRILLVEDDNAVREATKVLLEDDGFVVEGVADGPSAMARFVDTRPDAVVVDIGLPGMDGHEVCRRIRAISPVPIMVLTARDSPDQIVASLEAGADDHLTKPFSPVVLVARLRALARRGALVVFGPSIPPEAPWPGQHYPLGAAFDGSGVNFSVFSEAAERVELCLFDDRGEEQRLDLPEVTGYCWHGYVPDLAPGQRYGYRVHGPWSPREGLRCNPAKLLLDPYAKAIEGSVVWSPAVLGHVLGDPTRRETTDNAGQVPRSVVVNPFFDWGDDHLLRTPLVDTVIYEAHVKGATMLHPGVPPGLRGTFAGLAHPAFIEHLTGLGVTALELMPVHQFVHDGHLVDRGLRNYWGYNSIGFFAPHNEYSSRGQLGGQVQDFRQMVRSLHEAGIEVILDVVYNHTAEGNHLGPTLSFRGLDNLAYYRTVADEPVYYMDYTGTGNSLNMRHPQTLQMVMDSLRYWVLDMHVDGFRFDLAATLARELHDVDRLSAFFDIIHQDPVLSQVKLIAEPWDVGEGGYQVGNFPALWTEWNGRYRDTVRDFWRGEPSAMGEFAYRLTGSSDLYESNGRRPYASLNFVTAHDGFTLADLVSYNDKHNEANGEGNVDGDSHNRSWNCGIEGPTDDPQVRDLRDRQRRNMMATLLLSQGIPMIVAGDELGRSQGGNNNAYCQDNPLSWVHWEHVDADMLAFCARLVELRRECPVLRRRRFFHGRTIMGTASSDIGWYAPDGTVMQEEQWTIPRAGQLTVFLNGSGIHSRGRRGERIVGDDLLIVFNAHWEPARFHVPPALAGGWVTVIDTARWEVPDPATVETTMDLEARTLAVHRRPSAALGL